jgi:hypothetical protein
MRCLPLETGEDGLDRVREGENGRNWRREGMPESENNVSLVASVPLGMHWQLFSA